MFWYEGCNKNFGSDRNYSVHTARDRACNLRSSTSASLSASRHQDAHLEGVIAGENQGDPQLSEKHNDRATYGNSVPTDMASVFDE